MSAWWLGWLLLVAAGAGAQPAVPGVDDLQRLAGTIRAEHTPLVLVVWAHDCPYCRVLDEKILRPLQASGELEGRALLRRLELDGPDVRDFDGRLVTSREFADRYDAWFTPTVLFLDADGTELAERMVGLSNVDFYPAYLEQAIDRAVARLAPERLTPRP